MEGSLTLLIIVLEFIMKELMYEHLVHKKELMLVEKYSESMARILQTTDNIINKTVNESTK